MGSLAVHQSVPAWEAEITRIADERHIAAWSGDAGERLRFAGRLGAFIQGIGDSQLVRLFGHSITGIEELCRQLEHAIPPDQESDDPALRRRVTGPAGITARLRCEPEFAGRGPIRRRYIVWHDADVLIKHDRTLFGDVADAIAGVSAESEYACDGGLLVTRAVYIGGSRLAAYADDADGQLRAWRNGGSLGSGEPFWRVVSGLARPPVLAAPIAKLLADPEGLATEMLLGDLELDDALGY